MAARGAAVAERVPAVVEKAVERLVAVSPTPTGQVKQVTLREAVEETTLRRKSRGERTNGGHACCSVTRATVTTETCVYVRSHRLAGGCGLLNGSPTVITDNRNDRRIVGILSTNRISALNFNCLHWQTYNEHFVEAKEGFTGDNILSNTATHKSSMLLSKLKLHVKTPSKNHPPRQLGAQDRRGW